VVRLLSGEAVGETAVMDAGLVAFVGVAVVVVVTPGPDTALTLRNALVISNLANPKSAVFFTSLLPQFVPAGRTSFLALLALGLIYCSITLAWLSAYAVAVAKVGVVLRRPIIRRAIEAVTGVVLTALGLRLASERR